MGGNSANSANSKNTLQKIPPHIVGIVGIVLCTANNANSYRLAGWLLAAWLLAAVGSANNANTVRSLHELTIVCLLHELNMVAGGQVAEGRGGMAERGGQR